MTVRGTQDPNKLEVDELPDILSFDGGPRLDDGAISADFRLPTGGQPDPTLLRLTQTGDFQRLYPC